MRYRLRRGFSAKQRDGRVVKGSESPDWTVDEADPVYLGQPHKFEAVEPEPTPEEKKADKAVLSAPKNRAVAAKVEK